MVSTVCTSVREGLAAIRIADFLNNKLSEEKGEQKGPTGACIVMDTGTQSTIGGVGKIFEQFRQNGKVTDYTGFEQEPTEMYDKKSYHTAPCRLMTFEQTYYRMPYDCCSRKSPDNSGQTYS